MTTVAHASASPVERDARGPAWAPAAVSVSFALAMFGAVIAVRWHSQVSNVDDYAYALQTRAYLDAIGLHPHALVDAWRQYGSYSPLVPMIALPVAAVDSSLSVLVLVQVIPLLVLLFSARSLLASLGCRLWVSWLAAALITTVPPVLGYAAMYHFGLAATACTVLAADAYARSARLRRRRAALVLGLALGLLAVARVIAPVYIAALLAAIFVDGALDRADRRARATNAALAAVVAVVVAAPWWLAAGPTATRYLTSAGYGSGAFTAGGSRAEIALHRLTWTATETGWLLALVIATLTLWALACVARRVAGWRLGAFLIAVALLSLAFLATSSNAGTAFALPVVALLCCPAVWGIEHLRRPVRGVAIAACLASLVLPALGLLGLVGHGVVRGRALWQVDLPGATEARAALGCRRCAPPDTDALADHVLAIVGRRPVLVVRDDAVVNVESLRYVAKRHGFVPAIVPVRPDGRVTPRELSRVAYVVAGGTLGPYHPNVNGFEVLSALDAARFQRVYERKLGAFNDVAIWAAPDAPRRRG